MLLPIRFELAPCQDVHRGANGDHDEEEPREQRPEIEGEVVCPGRKVLGC